MNDQRVYLQQRRTDSSRYRWGQRLLMAAGVVLGTAVGAAVRDPSVVLPTAPAAPAPAAVERNSDYKEVVRQHEVIKSQLAVLENKVSNIEGPQRHEFMTQLRDLNNKVDEIYLVLLGRQPRSRERR